MSYIQESLSPGEKIYKVTHYHWMYLAGSFVGAGLFVIAAMLTIFLAIIYHYYDIVKLPPWMIHKAAAELAFKDYIAAFWHINVLFRVAAFVMLLMALIQVGARLLVRATTEMAVTNRRVVLKRGLVSRKVEEMRIDYIEGADVNQTMLGRLLGYGQIKIYGTGTESIVLPVFAEDPVNFRRALEAARTTFQVSPMQRVPIAPGDELPQSHAPQPNQGPVSPSNVVPPHLT